LLVPIARAGCGFQKRGGLSRRNDQPDFTTLLRYKLAANGRLVGWSNLQSRTAILPPEKSREIDAA